MSRYVALVSLVCAATILLFGNWWLVAAFFVGTAAIVWVCYVGLWPMVTPQQHMMRRVRGRKRYTANSVKMIDCPTCGGAGAMRLIPIEGGKTKLVKIPRSEWEHAKWRYANLVDCRTCNGLGLVADLSDRTHIG